MKKNIKEGRKEEMKRKRNLKEEGITLIALVVTIIILLILAGVTVSLVVGQNGLLQRAQKASNTMANATANELAQMGQYASDIESLTSGFIAGGGSEQGGSGEGSGSGSGSGTSGSITIKEGDTAVDIATIGSKYGRDVEYNENTYQLFYVDTIGKYSGGTPGIWLQLKTPILTNSYRPDSASNSTLITTENSILWNVNPDMKQYYNTIKAKTSQDANMLGVSGLCDPANWNTRNNVTYVPTEDQAKGAFAIGGVSAEMFCDSYNAYKGRTSTDTGYYDAKAFNANRTYGYYYKPKHANVSSSYQIDGYGNYTDYTNYPTQTTEASGMYRYDTSTYTWLASPSAYYASIVCYVGGNVGYLNYNGVRDSSSVRLAVFLPSSIPISLKN